MTNLSSSDYVHFESHASTISGYDHDGTDDASATGYVGVIGVGQNDRPFACPEDGCGYRSPTHSRLRTHMLTHTRPEPSHYCDWPGCKFAAVQIGNLRSHRRTHTQERLFTCAFPRCMYSAARRSNLKRHLLMQTLQRRFACQEPGCTFRAQGQVRFDAHRLCHSRPLGCPAGCPILYCVGRCVLPVSGHSSALMGAGAGGGVPMSAAGFPHSRAIEREGEGAGTGAAAWAGAVASAMADIESEVVSPVEAYTPLVAERSNHCASGARSETALALAQRVAPDLLHSSVPCAPGNSRCLIIGGFFDNNIDVKLMRYIGGFKPPCTLLGDDNDAIAAVSNMLLITMGVRDLASFAFPRNS